ncbi:hypothetical protein GX586_16440, partial [bacterium]|nr:hypothetical protein [bacterium]
MARKATTFEGLAWQDLEEWAGSAVVSRGKGYSQLVHDLAMAEDGCLVAWVDGTHRYATAVGFDASGNLESTCTCPYAIACKHAVATILVYLKAVEEGTEVPRAAGDDERLVRLSEKEEGALAVPEPGQQ